MPLTPHHRLDHIRLADELRRALPEELRGSADDLAATIASGVAGDAGAEVDQRLSPALGALAGQVVRSDRALVSFGAGAQAGDVHISGVAGGDIYHLTINLAAAPAPETPLAAAERGARARLIAQVRATWLEGVLYQSLYAQVRLDLGLSADPSQVDLPLRAQVQEAGGTRANLPTGTRLLTLYDGVGGALLILGAPGAGKTTLLLELARDLLVRAEADPRNPVPVVLNLASWAARREPLERWIAAELVHVYRARPADAEGWLAADALLPLLDGLDEVAEEHRAACLAAINAFRASHGQMPPVVCTRQEEYERLAPRAGRLQLERALVVQPLSPAEVQRFLDEAGAPLAGLSAALAEDAQLEELTDTPLMLSVLAAVYRGKSAGDVVLAGDAAGRRAAIFGAYVDAMFERRGRPLYSKEVTARYLGWLASRMRGDDSTLFYIEELQPTWMREGAVNRPYLIVAWGLVVLVLGLIVLSVIAGGSTSRGQGPSYQGIVFGCFAAVSFVILLVSMAWKDPRFYTRINLPVTVIERLDWSWEAARRGFIEGATWIRRDETVRSLQPFIYIYGIMLLIAVMLPNGLSLVTTLALMFGSFLGFFSLIAAIGRMFFAGLQKQIDVASRTRPNHGIWRSGQNLVKAMLVIAVGSGLALAAALPVLVVAVVWLSSLITPREGLDYGQVVQYGALAGVAIGVIIGLTVAPFTFGVGPLVAHLLLRVAVVWGRVGPWNYARFLDHCVDRILMRRVGGGYIFVHRLLLDYFADRATPPASKDGG